MPAPLDPTNFMALLEPQAPHASGHAEVMATVSIAISLKRLADLLERTYDEATGHAGPS